GATLAAASYNIPRVVLGTKRKYTAEIAALRAEIAAQGAGVEIFEMDSFYPAGDEQVLIYEITGKTVPPGGIPIALGIVVVNVTTLLNIYRASLGEPVTRRYVTVNGEVAHPCVVDAPVGSSPEDLIEAAGGARIREYSLVRGGPMMGRQYPGGTSGLGFGKADGGLLVLPSDNRIFTIKNQPIEHVILQARSTCIQCTLCTELCPRYLIGHQMRPHRVMRSVALGPGNTANAEGAMDALLCSECGICELFSCPMGLSPRRMNVYMKGLLRPAGASPNQDVYPSHTRSREYRRIAQSRFIERLGLGRYDNHVSDLVRLDPEQVKIPLKHGVGRPSEPCVSVGDAVAVGDVIAAVEQSEVGCLVHASIDGRISSIDPEYITIRRVK
ncbi:MAG: 4Fe-4S dicluster domain-containing protein, partial [Propionibacteriaceae bacterium]|nr:4Fe-4S dicluster domain-containing protein [Propionibacteriaceae bacterium]